MAKAKLSKTDFLTDKLFIEWRLLRTPELEGYWTEFVRNHPESEQAFESAIRIFNSVRINDNKLTPDEAENLYKRIVRDSTHIIKRRQLIRCFSAAACFLLVITAALLIGRTDDTTPMVTSETIIGQAMPDDDICIISGGNLVPVSGNTDIVVDEQGILKVQGQTDIDRNLELEITKEVKIVVPYGKYSTLTLSDGSRVWLNAGTTVEFPAEFSSKERRIKVDGEIYIEVAQDKTKPFFVTTPTFDVRVYGTSFNVSCYQQEIAHHIVLAEGSVSVEMDGQSQMLEPNQMMLLEDGAATIQEVDVDEYISWKDGSLKLYKTSIEEILGKVGRFYNLNFSNSSSSLMKRTCTGRLLLSEDIEEVMSILCSISNTKFEKNGNTIYINNK